MMDSDIVLAGQSSAVQVARGETVQVDVCVCRGQQYCPSPVAYCGTVIDQNTGRPVEDAWITLRNGPYTYRCKTQSNGRFEIVLPYHWSAVSIQIIREGYGTRYIGMHFLTRPDDVFYIC